jgi:hypothetical protein
MITIWKGMRSMWIPRCKEVTEKLSSVGATGLNEPDVAFAGLRLVGEVLAVRGRSRANHPLPLRVAQKELDFAGEGDTNHVEGFW